MTNRVLAKAYEVPLLKGKETSGKDELDFLFHKTQDPIFVKILELRGYDTLINNYIPNWQPKKDGRVHTQWGFKAASGQLDSRSPNILNCFDSETEILTEQGWKKFKEIDKSTYVAQWDLGVINFVLPLEYIENDYKGNLYHIKTEEQIDLMVTPNHDCLVQNRKTGEYKVFSGENYPNDYKQIQGGEYIGGDWNISFPQVILLCAFQADGHEVLNDRQVNKSITFTFTKQRKIDRLLYAITELDLAHTVKKTIKGQTRIYLNAPLPEWLEGKKFFGDWILTLTNEALEFMAREVFFWDGAYLIQNQYASSIKTNADWVQILQVLTNRRGYIFSSDYGQYGKKLWQVMKSERNYSLTSNRKIKTIPYDGKVYCVSVHSGYIVTRRNNKVAITGNCSKHTKIGQRFRKVLVAPEGYTWVECDKKSFHVASLGYLANDKDYLRFASLDPHSIFTSYIMPSEWGEAISFNWSDSDILEACKEIKKRSKEEKEKTGIDLRQDVAKPCVLGNQLGLGPYKLWYKNRRSIKSQLHAKELQEVLGNLFPKPEEWKKKIIDKADKETYLVDEWGKVQFFYEVFRWEKNKLGRWERKRTPEAEQVLAFRVQGVAFGMLKYEHLKMEKLGWNERYNFTNSIHDSLVFLPRIKDLDRCIADVTGIMNSPCDRLVNEATGPKGLVVKVEASVGKNLADYHEERNIDGMREVK